MKELNQIELGVILRSLNESYNISENKLSKPARLGTIELRLERQYFDILKELIQKIEKIHDSF